MTQGVWDDIITLHYEGGAVAQWERACLACRRPRVRIPSAPPPLWNHPLLIREGPGAAPFFFFEWVVSLYWLVFCPVVSFSKRRRGGVSPSPRPCGNGETMASSEII